MSDIIYLPPDAYCLLSTVDHCLTSTDKINLVIASKQLMLQWLNMQDAVDIVVAAQLYGAGRAAAMARILTWFFAPRASTRPMK